MRHVKFILSALAILLAGAVAAGVAARSVAAPRTGEVVNAGVVPVPSVLGQTAEEALFYPWSLYGMQELTPIPEYVLNTLMPGDMLTSIAAFELFELECDMEQLAKSQVWDEEENSPPRNTLLVFLKDFPASLADGGIPVSLNYALSEVASPAVSWLIRPQTQTDLTDEERRAALDKVQEDLAGLLRLMLVPDRNYSNDLTDLLTDFGNFFNEADLLTFYGWVETLLETLYHQYGTENQTAFYESSPAELPLPDGSEAPSSPPSLEELMKIGSGGPVDIQFISTPRQVVLLFTSGRITCGIYYDVQLQCYSGFGLSFQ